MYISTAILSIPSLSFVSILKMSFFSLELYIKSTSENGYFYRYIHHILEISIFVMILMTFETCSSEYHWFSVRVGL